MPSALPRSIGATRETASRTTSRSFAETLMIHFSCPFCSQLLKAPDRAAGRVMPCTACGQHLTVPHLVSAVPNPAPVLTPIGPVPRVRRPTSLHRTFFCPACGSDRQPYPGEVRPRCHNRDCDPAPEMLSELYFVLYKDRHVLAFYDSGVATAYTPEGEETATRFIDLCLEIVNRGVPAAVVVASELAKVGEPEDSLNGTSRMRAFLATVPYYELFYERLMMDPASDPTPGTRLDVIEAVIDHPLYRASASRCERGVFDRPPTNPALLPAIDYGYVRNPFEEAEDGAARAGRQARKQARDDTLVRFILLPFVLLAAIGGLFLTIFIPDQYATLQTFCRLGCVVVGGAAVYGMAFWESL